MDGRNKSLSGEQKKLRITCQVHRITTTSPKTYLLDTVKKSYYRVIVLG